MTHKVLTSTARHLGIDLVVTLRAYADRATNIMSALLEPRSHAKFITAIAAAVSTGLLVFAPMVLAKPTHVFSSSFGSPGADAGQLALARVSYSGRGEVQAPGSGLAINQATGDVYVADTGNNRIDQFSSAGIFVRAWGWGVKDGSHEFQVCTMVSGCEAGLPGSGPGQFEEATFIAVDNSEGESEGDVYVADPGNSVVSKFEADGSPVTSWGTTGQLSTPRGPAGIAIGSSGDLFVLEGIWPREEFTVTLTKYTQAGAKLFTHESNSYGNAPEGLAIDTLGNLIRVSPYAAIQKLSETLDPSITELAPKEEALAFAIDTADNNLFAAQFREGGVIDGFASNCANNCIPSESFGAGSISSPSGLAVGSNHVVYAADAGLQRIGVFEGPFNLPTPNTGGAAAITDSTATLNGTVDPEGEEVTECFFEYGETNSFGHAAPCLAPGASEIGGGIEAVKVHADLVGLSGNRFYHYRLVAADAHGADRGSEQTFTTLPAPEAPSNCPNEALRRENISTTLPKCRAYELVSPAGASGEVYVPEQGPIIFLKSELASRAAASGEGVVYVADPPPLGGNGAQGNGLGDQYVATRSTSGWSANVITPAATFPANQLQSGYLAFSGDLSRGIAYPVGQSPLTGKIPSLSAGAPPDCRVLYTHTGGDIAQGFQALFTETQESNIAPQENCGNPFFAGSSDDYSALFFQTEAALAPKAKPATNSVISNNEFERCYTSCNLYGSITGHLELISRLPNNTQVAGATFGGPSGGPAGPTNERPNFSNAISADGSRAFWTDTSTGKIYVRENPGTPKARTVQVSVGKAQYWTATPDGRYAYYTENGALIRVDLQAEPGHQRELLAPSAAGVQGVIGVNEEGPDGAYLYFVAAGKLSADAEARSCQVGEHTEEEEGHLPTGIGCNLYLLHAGQITFVSALSILDDRLANVSALRASGVFAGDWIPDLGSRTAQLTPDGHSLLFQSVLHLTGADGSVPVHSMFDYNADTAVLSCVSCDPSGAPRSAEGGTLLWASPPLSYSPTYMKRWISSDGSSVFFETEQALVPEDSNGLQDVYEWQRQGTSECPAAIASPRIGGCLHLLSDGGGDRDSWLLEASASGNDVFIITRDSLTSAARNGQQRLFDARAGGGFPSAGNAVICESSEACHAAGSQPPPPSSAGTSTFKPHESPPVHKCKRGAIKKRGKCVNKKHHSKKHRHQHRKRAGDHDGGGHR